MNQPKKIFKPLELDDTMEGWLIHSHKGRDRHDHAARRFEKMNNLFGILTIIFSAITGTSIFVSISKSDVVSEWIRLVVGILSASATVFASLQTFQNYSERAEKHRAIGVKYKNVIRCIERITPNVDFQEEIKKINEQLNQLEDSAPVVPYGIYIQIETQYENVKFVSRAEELY